MTQEIIPFSIVPKNLSEAMDFAKMIASSSFCPPSMRGKPGDVILAMQMGSEVGLNPMQAIQNIAVINSRPCLWGDAALAVVINCSAYVSHREWSEGSIEGGDFIAYCGVTRKGSSEEHIKSYSISDAKRAGLWTKPGIWQQYPERMLQMRARAFAIRDKFADALRGLYVREEVEDYQVIEKQKNIQSMQSHKKSIEIKDITTESMQECGEITEQEFIEPYTIEKAFEEISNASTQDDLKIIFQKAQRVFKTLPEDIRLIIDAKDKRKMQLITQQAQEYKNLSEGT